MGAAHRVAPGGIAAVTARIPALLASLLLGCDRAPALPAPPPPVLLRAIDQSGPALLLVPAPGARLNARVPAALELGGGRVLRFDRGARDSAGDYFAGAAWAPRPSALPDSGLLRLSYCRADESFCRSEQLTVALPD